MQAARTAPAPRPTRSRASISAAPPNAAPSPAAKPRPPSPMRIPRPTAPHRRPAAAPTSACGYNRALPHPQAAAMPLPTRPLLSHASRPLTVEIPAINEHGETVPTSIAGEHPLTLYVDKREIVTLMTLGAAPEALTIGWLRNQ